MRRSYQKTPKGELYCIEWPEWHVECAHEDCDLDLLISDLGQSLTLAEATKRAQARLKSGTVDGWVRRGKKWYCPIHKEVKHNDNAS